MRWVPKLQLSIGSSFNKEQLVWWISGSWSTRGKLAGDIGRSVFCCLMSFLDTTATSSSHFPSAVGIFQVSCCLRNWWTEYTSLASTSQQQPANGHHLPNHKVILYGNSILWPSRYCSSPNLLASWCAAMTDRSARCCHWQSVPGHKGERGQGCHMHHNKYHLGEGTEPTWTK